MLNVLHAATSTLGKSLLDFIFPRCCPVCDAIIRTDKPVCGQCAASLITTASAFEPPARCIPHVDSVSVLLPYSESCRAVIHALKYHGNPTIGDWLGRHMAGKTLRLLQIPDDMIVVPVPLHPNRLKERGYNQSERIANGFTQVSGHRIDTNLLVRTRATSTQTKLGEDERRENVRNVFHYVADKPLERCPVILIDDVLTTGSTISECARVLKENGAGHITVCVAATPGVGED